MRFRRLVVPVIVAVLVVGGAFTAYQVSDYAQGSAAEQDGYTTVENETVMQQVDMWQFVNATQRQYTTGFNDSVTVYNNSSVELQEGTDYEWNETDGTIYFYDTASTEDNAPANVTYEYSQNTQAVKELGGPVTVLTEAVGRYGFLGAAGALVVFLIAFGAIAARAFADSGPSTNR